MNLTATPIQAALLSVVFAITATGAEFIDWPSDPPYAWERIPVSKLPAGVHPQDPEDPERPLTSVEVRHVDVEGDGASDLIVSIGRGGTDGSYVFDYRRDGKRYREVLAEQGGIVVSRERGQVECWSRAGGMHYRRTVYRFNGRRFVELFADSLKGPLEDDRFEIVERRKPKQP
jgi:hypothetical protein